MTLSALNSIFLIVLLSGCVVQGLEVQTSEQTTTIHDEDIDDNSAIGSNDTWSPRIDEMNGVRMAMVPPGCFVMGIREEEIDYLRGFPSSSMELDDFADQMPAHEVCFEEPFWIDIYEVTQGQFSRFDGDAGMQSYFQGDDLPRENISWVEAQRFCEQRDARLPTEAEWEYAARGPVGNLFPWGNVFECNMGNFDDEEEDDIFLIDGAPNCDGYFTTAPVGVMRGGVSWVGVMDLAGNVWEWVADIYDSRFYRSQSGASVNPLGPTIGDLYVIRGGAWSIDEVDHLAATFRGGIDPEIAAEHLGFRCAMSSD